MNESKLAVLLATVISFLDESTGETREGILYAGLMGHCDMDEFRTLVSVLVKMGAVERGPNFLLKLTEKGRGIAKMLAEKIANAKRAKIAPV